MDVAGCSQLWFPSWGSGLGTQVTTPGFSQLRTGLRRLCPVPGWESPALVSPAPLPVGPQVLCSRYSRFLLVALRRATGLPVRRGTWDGLKTRQHQPLGLGRVVPGLGRRATP